MTGRQDSAAQACGGRSPLRLRRFATLQDYGETLAAMQAFTLARASDTSDECWLLQHPPVYTLGLNGKTEHILAPGEIPVLRTDRGGQVTYHGPGQWVAYLLLDLRRQGIGVRQLVHLLEQSVIDLLAEGGVPAERRHDAPGVYVDGAKIASLGLRIRSGCSYHGLALNTAMDLAPFGRINPCGYQGLAVTQVRDLLPDWEAERVALGLLRHLGRVLGRPMQEVEGETRPRET
ncbi:MAG: lipoyl(octanoyl) transferase LipB [Pseudomonadota bacterium]